MDNSPSLNPKQLRFCQEYVIDSNGTQAAIRAGYSVKTAQEQSSRLLLNVIIQEKIKSLEKTVAERLGITHEYVLKNFQAIADRCMQAEEVMVKGPGGQMVGTGEYRFDSTGANRALELIGKHLTMFTEKIDHSNKDGTLKPAAPSVVFRFVGISREEYQARKKAEAEKLKNEK
jgi:phage terminase small subunit